MIDLVKKIAKKCPQGALMGMDIGKKTIGIAISDSAQSIAMPLQTIKRTKFSKDIKKIESLIVDYDIKGFVLGYPLNMDSTEGPKCQSVKDFALEFKAQLSPDVKPENLWIGLQDERLSTATVEDFVDSSVDISKRRAKEKGIIDKLAAQVILQGALDYMVVNR